MIREMVAGMIIKDKKLLLVHNTKHSGLRIEPPGGKKEINENLEEAVVREIQEEIDLTVNPVKLFGKYETNSPEGKFIVSMYLCEIVSGEIKLMEPEKISDYKWYSYKEIIRLKEAGVLVPNMCDAIPMLKGYL